LSEIINKDHHVQSPGHRISEFLAHSRDHGAYVVSWPWAPDLGRCLVIQETDMGHVHIRLRDDVSNEEALRHAAKLLQAVAAPPKPREADELEQQRDPGAQAMSSTRG
jgi:hypothetical protein